MMLQRLSQIESNEFNVDFYNFYSRFKHGSKSCARYFGRICENLLSDLPLDNKRVIIYSAPYNNIPTASNSFKDYLLSFSAPLFVKKNTKIVQGYVNRSYSYDSDYGSMSYEERRNAISSDLFHIDKSFISKEDILIFVDDIRITGSHEERMVELIKRENIENDVFFVYLASYLGNDPTTENRLNHHSVKNLTDINDIIVNDEFIFNTRVVKFILNADIQEFVSFITYQNTVFKRTLYSLSVLNDYHKNDKYKMNFSILQNLL